YGTHTTDNYYYSRTNLAMRGAGHHEENDIQSHVIFIPIGRGAIDVTYHYALYVYDVGYLENAFLIKGSFTRHWGHYGNPFLGDYYLSCGIGR
ncbi:MAG: hypothetical protein J6328_07110, partial [Bacilli bacterium]|nr:hypothetical protein [Bacilli bacterium]